MKKIMLDKPRYKSGGKVPLFLVSYRGISLSKNKISKSFYRALLKLSKVLYLTELPENLKLGKGIYFAHPYSITINEKAVIGDNCNIYKGVLIGQQNRGKKVGAPVIGNEVYIGANSCIVGKVIIGDDVLIAPNTFVNVDVPSHSVVFGNPCIIKPNSEATKSYIDNKL